MAEGHNLDLSSNDGGVKQKITRQRRMRFEKTVFEDATGDFLSSLKLALFKDAFPKHYEHNPKKFELSYSQLLTNLSNYAKQDIKDLVEEQEVTEKLDKLDDLCRSCSSSQPVWRPCGNPEMDVKAHLNKAKKEVKERLVEELHKQREEWALVSKTVMEKREKIRNLQGSLRQLSEMDGKGDYKKMEECDRKLLHFAAHWPNNTDLN